MSWRLAIGLLIVAGIIGAFGLHIRIILDCGLLAFIKGAEWLWLLGRCN